MTTTRCRAAARSFAFATFSALVVPFVIPAAWAAEVIPDFYRDPGLYPNRSYVNQSFNEHIDPFTGALEHHYVDIQIPGNGGFDLKVIRSYNSAAVDPTNLTGSDQLAGLGWTVHFGRILNKNSSPCINSNAMSTVDNPVLELPDGSRQILAFTGGSSPLMLTTQRWKAECNSGGGLIVYSPEGVRYDMTQLVNIGTDVSPLYAWYTTRITDRNGNYATLAYTANSPQVTTVTTNDGRSLSFTYADTGLASRRITSVTGAGQTYTYNYTAVSGVTGRYFLTSVTRPDNLNWSYSYNGNMGTGAGSYVMNRANYPQGGYLSYGYSILYPDAQNVNSRTSVVTSKSQSTGGSWSFSYSPGGVGIYDTTTVTGPSGTTTYKHVGPNYATSGSVWMVGLLMSKTIGSVQTETYSWVKQKISSESTSRPGYFSSKVDTGETNAPLLSQRTIIRDGATYQTSYGTFDGYGNPTTVTESGPNGGSRTTSLSYNLNTAKWIVNQVKNESFTGRSISRTFDANGNLTAITRDGVTTSYGYDSQGNVSSVTMPRSLTHTYASYKRGIPQSESHPESITISRVVSDAGNVTSETNGEGKTTSYGYDTMNRVTSIGMPTGNGVSISYGTTSRTATRGTLTESTSYDGFGRVTGVTLGGISRSYSVDALGRRTFESDPGASAGKSYQYDILDRLTRVTNEDSTYRSIAYGSGSMTATDERGKATTTTLRAYGDPDSQFPMSVAAADSAANISLVRNSVDQVTSATQAGFTRSFAYNSNGYLASVANPETGTTTYGRDAAGNMTSRSVGASGTTVYTYDGQNRLASILFPGQSVASVTYGYNKVNKLLSVIAPAANRSYAYDANGNLTSESLTVDGYSLTAGYAYNGNDQMTSITYPRSGSVVSYAPDVLGRPTQVSGYVNSISYWPSGQINQIAYANGTVSAYGQNNRLWPGSFGTWKGGGSYYLNSSYSYDGVGNLTAVSDSVDSSAYNRTLGYDNLNRLTSIAGPWGSGTIAYTGNGNITSQTLGSFSLGYSYDTANRLVGVSGSKSASYGYDVYGDISTISGAAFTYDDTQNMRCAFCGDSVNRVDYAYDGNNQRVVVSKSGVKTYEMVGSNGNLLIEFTPAQTNKLVEYIYLGGKRVAQVVSP